MAAKAAIIAQIYGDFSRFHEFLMISTDPLTEKLVDKALVYASVDKSVFAKYGDSLLVKQAIERDNNVSNLLNIKATPTFIVNDELIVGYNINQISNAVI